MSDIELMSPPPNSGGDESDDELNKRKPRRDEFIVFNNDKDLRHYESIRVKAQYFTGIVLRCKQLTPQNMDNILKAIEIDYANY
jgi:predicted nuclease of predicted toxin-antitoxin system